MLTDLMGGELTPDSTPGVGSTFRVRLFLPEVHACRPRGRAAVQGRRRGYEGRAASILVVDNEEADRELLVQLLEPLGFELRTAASGHDALDLLAAGYSPTSILMDLAMPGIDGWETCAACGSWSTLRARVAIVSANAFDKGLDNDAGIRPRISSSSRCATPNCSTGWSARSACAGCAAAQARAAAAGAAAATAPLPDAAALKRLAAVVQLGFYRGILNQLDAIEAGSSPNARPSAPRMRELARQFQFEAMGVAIARPRRPGAGGRA
jgi:CheY-like chemotaxis protein